MHARSVVLVGGLPRGMNLFFPAGTSGDASDAMVVEEEEEEDWWWLVVWGKPADDAGNSTLYTRRGVQATNNPRHADSPAHETPQPGCSWPVCNAVGVELVGNVGRVAIQAAVRVGLCWGQGSCCGAPPWLCWV